MMAFHDKTLEMQLQLEAALTGEERDQEAKHWVALSERTQIARREARARIRQMEGSLSDCSARSNDLGHRCNSKTSVKERLPELKMPVFSGKVLEFPAFWDRFQGCVHNRTDLDEASKFSYLLSSLSREALAAVEGIPSSSANYSHAMELLQVRFGHTDVIVREHVKAIWNAKSCSDSGDSMQALVDEINRNPRSLTALGKNLSTGEMTANEAFLPLLAEKFPEEIRLAWDVHVQSVSGTKGDLPEFFSFAQIRAAAKRAAAASSGGRGLVKQDDPKQQEPDPDCRERQRTRQTEKRAARGATTVLHAAVNNSCLICKGDHDVASCEEFLQADAHTRSRMAARNKLCFRCLQSGHRAKACKSPPRDQTPQAPRSRSCMLTANGGAQQVRLQSVRARAFGKDGQCVLVQCLLDPGSQSSFIRKDVADALELTGPHEAICLVTVDNEGGKERRMRRVELHLGAVEPSQPRIRYPIHALVLPKICGKIRQAPAKLSEWPHLSNLPVADQCEERTLTIDVLIGLNHYFNLVGSDVRRCPAGGPVAIHSQLGWILCGQTSRRPTTAVTTLLAHVECNSIGPEKYGCVERLFRITAYCQRFVRNCRLPAEARQSGALTVAERQKAEGTWVRMAQSKAFSSELQALSRKGRAVATSRLSRLDPFVDEEGFLRVGGRLENAELPSHMKHPVILTGDHALTMSLIRHCHARQLHAGTTHTLAILRQQYWVLKGRTQVKKVIRHCFACRRAMARPIQPRMAALPSSRVVEAAAFAHTGMDFAGPLLIRVGKKATSKCYVCLFTCMASRAVHLERVPQMTTARVMKALRRFIAGEEDRRLSNRIISAPSKPLRQS
ncbi:hypothetical protein T07_1928 [Trichinella nelsoni]|uniref:CCHC-type domain-containing protein n=1 Tax=Trichinella nelsoni TaxID=6336 RepID=A0A0V0RGH0_9BILA|nr:hypothetical protein T07_1928 [Trichinella nelsoni]